MMAAGESISTGKLRLLRPRTRRPNLAAAAVLACWAGLGVAYALAAPVAVIGTLWAAAGLGGLAWLSGGGLRAADRSVPLFNRLYETAPYPAYLVSPEGVILRQNLAASRGAPAGDTVDEVLGAALAAVDTTVYRLGRTAQTEGRARTLCRVEGDSWELWRLQRPVESEPDLAPAPAQEAAGGVGAASPDSLLEDLPVALARLDAEGRILFANRAARKLLNSSRCTLM